MSTPYQLPENLPYAPVLNPQLTQTQLVVTADMAYTSLLKSFPGDPIAGINMPGTSQPTNSASQVQRMVWTYLNEKGMGITDADMINVGPKEPWNASYNDVGLGGTGINPAFTPMTGLLEGSGTRVTILFAKSA